ncbi:phospholipase D-like domain-containing protein [Granulosicoccus antarcticus]|uniref:Cardiolipin synthase B n=1 Tax=Granulosicoccus antarcticus IMCC3135 TaxID=1192854 RepID=A0A2Z2NXR6_9GAMM|nr:phospholipase D-like domain-containing protein [Granulosicoccus antarcticus]ASJ72547.1 Cardiolipin synthase B [Granulosicoccus antarcticus IMCC3135]
MVNSKTWRRFRRSSGQARSGRRWGRRIMGAIIVYAVLSIAVRAWVPAPPAVGLAGMQYNANYLQFFQDISWLNSEGERQMSQETFDQVFRMIGEAEEFVLLDMFLFNAWQGPVPEEHRALSEELTQALIEQKQRNPDMLIIVISDPINTVYGGLESVHFKRLRDAAIPVVLTDLNQLQDSNPTWSGFWRFVVRPFGNGSGDWLPNPFGEGRVSVRSYLSLLNFKANHRKLLVSDDGEQQLRGLVTSANPHDGSSAHRNIALSFSGPAVMDLINGERELLAMSGADEELQRIDSVLAEQIERHDNASQIEVMPATEKALVAGSSQVQVLSESRIRAAVLQAINQAFAGDAIDLAMFYLSERQIIEALKEAVKRDVTVRALLDINSDAFGRRKNGVPNRPVAAELTAAGVDVKWCATSGEQCHAKWLHVSHETQSGRAHEFILGSANFTRRNLMDLNMETNVRVSTVAEARIATQMIEFFDKQWNNQQGRTYSYPYSRFADDSPWLKLQYRFMEMSGLSTF